MTFNARSIERARAAVPLAGAALFLFSLAGCAKLFPPSHRAASGATSPTPAPPAAAAPATAAAPAAKSSATLYHRLGGFDGIAAFTDDFLGRATNDPAIVPFFKGLTTADLQRIRQHVADLLCAATGGPCFYPGRDMKTVHAQMEITNDTWNAFTGHLNETIARFKIGDRERNELVAIVASLKGDIVNK